MGRLTVSCDGGRSWVAQRSDDESARCFQDVGGGTLDCDHSPGAARGVTYGDGHFFATFGWGEPGKIMGSADGVTWERVHEGGTFGGLGYSAGRVVAAARDALSSSDFGATWSEPVYTGLSGWNVRRAATAGDLVVIAGDGDGDVADVLVTSDGGQTFFEPEELPAGCGADIMHNGGIAYGGGTIVLVGQMGVTCASTDGGRHFKAGTVGSQVDSHVLWTGSEFMAWSYGTAHRSRDGLTWTSEPTTPNDLGLGAVASDGRGTLVGVRGGWMVSYEDEVFYRSADGVTWERAESFEGSHPVIHMTFGYVEESDACD